MSDTPKPAEATPETDAVTALYGSPNGNFLGHRKDVPRWFACGLEMERNNERATAARVEKERNAALAEVESLKAALSFTESRIASFETAENSELAAERAARLAAEARLAELTARFARCGEMLCDPLGGDFCQIEDAIKETVLNEQKLREELAEAQKDTARMDWLNNHVMELHLTAGHVIAVDYGASVRAIIDAAMTEP